MSDKRQKLKNHQFVIIQILTVKLVFVEELLE